DFEDRVVKNFALERNIRRYAGGDDPGQILHAFEKLLDKCNPLPVLRIFGWRQNHFHRQQIVRMKSKIDMLKSLEALQHQSAAASNVIATAISETIKIFSHLRPAVPALRWSPSLRRGMTSRSLAPFHAGINPKITPVASVTSTAKIKTRVSILKLRKKAAREISWIGFSAARTGAIQYASSNPPAPPSNASNMLSVRSCRIKRDRL